MSLIKIKSFLREYTIEECKTFEQALEKVWNDGHSTYLVDESVFQLYQNSFATIPEEKVLLVHAVENNKSYEAIGPIIEKLLQKGFRKNNRLVVIGGGILQDIGCFISSLFARGIAWDFIPTTLLAQGDSCIGGKSSINLGEYKNPIGGFYPPFRIFLTTEVLKTLQVADIYSGLSEMIKIGIIDSQESYQFFAEVIQKYESHQIIPVEWVSKALQIKKRFIEEDEFDVGIRNLLNFGHTFGHAYESASQFEIPHGIAVAFGMQTACFVSFKRGYVTKEHYQNVYQVLKILCAQHAHIVKNLDIHKIEKAIRSDKKNSGSKIGCILSKGPGKIFKESLDWEAEVKPFVQQWQNDI